MSWAHSVSAPGRPRPGGHASACARPALWSGSRGTTCGRARVSPGHHPRGSRPVPVPVPSSLFALVGVGLRDGF